MDRNFMRPIRTYQKKKPNETIQLRTFNDSLFETVRNKCFPLSSRSNEIDEGGVDADNSAYDPFDTTFDRLLKKARMPPKLPKDGHSTIQLDSTDSSLQKSNKSSSKNRSYSFKVELFSKGKKARRKRKVLATYEKGKVKLRSSRLFKMNRSKVSDKENNKKAELITLDVNSSSVELKVNTSGTKKSSQKKRKNATKKSNVKKRKKDNNTTNVTSSSVRDTKRCSVHSTRFSMSDYSNKVNEKTDRLQQEINQANSSYNNVKQCYVRIQCLNEDSCAELSIEKGTDKSQEVNQVNSNLQLNDTNMKHCCVRIQRLREDSCTELGFKKETDQLQEVNPVNSSSLQCNDTNVKHCCVRIERLGENSCTKLSLKKESDQSEEQEVERINRSDLRGSDTNVKRCFVRVQRLEVDPWTELSFEKKSVGNNSNEDTKHCFVRLEPLNQNSYLSSRGLRNVHKIMITSTPAGRPLGSTTICLSPILMNCSEKLNDFSNNDSNSSGGKFDIPFKAVCNLYTKLKTEIDEYDDKPRLFSNLTLDVDECEQENTNEMNAISLTSCRRNSTVNISESKQNEASDSSRKYEIVQTNKQYLGCSPDPNRSSSLFNDTSRSVQSSLQNNVDPEVVSSLKISKEESYPNSRELRKSLSLSDTHLMVDRTQKELPASLVASTFGGSTDLLGSSNVNDKRRGTDLIKQSVLNVTPPLNTSDTPEHGIERPSTLSPCIVLNRLQDSIRITKRRRYDKWDLGLDDILEDVSDSSNSNKEASNKSKGRNTILLKKLQVQMIRPTESAVSIGADKSIYLKPGKCWARSLTILNNVRSGSDLEKLSIGKGKKWRRSVQDILNMQKRGSIHSCIKKNASDKELPGEINNKAEHEVASGKGRTTDSTNVGRVSRRISVRVVPIRKSVKSIEDAPFLEAYGIVPVRSQRFTLINNSRRSSGNIQIDNVDGQIVEEHPGLTAKEVILQRCVQKNYIPFSAYFTDSYLKHCRKIGEGVYGEVFLYEDEGKKSVIKIIPIEGNDYVNGEPQKKFHEILSEIVIAMELHNLRFNAKYNTDGFVEVKNIKCIVGKYPEKLIELWNAYDEEKCSDNDCPSMFRDDQLYIVLELGHGGQDLEAFVFNTAEDAHILFVQAALALAVAEEAIEFEHRDLHWGNVLISQTNEIKIHYRLGDKKIALFSKGVKVSIIDFTLSRVTYQGCSIFNDLSSDPTLFTAQGEYQFEIYRLMRDRVKNNWHKFEPYTNILWLHYTLDKMITEVRYRRKKLKTHRNGIQKLKELKDEILSYNSAFDFVTNCDKISSLYLETKSEVTVV